VAKSQPAQSGAADVGRDNPFAEIPRNKKPVPQEMSQSLNLQEEPPELVVETVTLRSLEAANLKKILDKMSSRYGSIITDAKTNSLIICDTKEYIEKILAHIQRADKAVVPEDTATEEKEEKTKPELFVETVTLKFLDSKSLKTVIEKMSSEYGSISADGRGNSLIICDTKETLEKILAEIRKADKTPQQIMVEVVILDVQLDDDTEIGINWDILSDKTYDIGYRQNYTTSRLGSTIESAANIGNATAFNTTGLGGELSVISGTIRNVVHLIQQKRDVEILASPRVMMVSGESAYIEAIEELPYTEVTDTAGGGELTSTEFKEVGVKLRVSATLADSNSILLTVEPEQNVTTGKSNTEVPIVDTRKAKTTLLLKDGQVVILGGLRRQEKTKETDQIPILGDLPIIGALFKSTTTVVKNSELVVFLSPHIYKGEPVPNDEMAKYDEITARPLLSIPHHTNWSIFPTSDEKDGTAFSIPDDTEDRLLEQAAR
jgi:type IV pilus assembly protein PilQ